MDDVIEARLGMSLDDLIKDQKKTTAMEVKKKKAVAAKGALKAKNAKPGMRKPVPGKGRPGNPNQNPNKAIPGARGSGGKPQPGVLKVTKGGGVHKKGGAPPTAMHIDPPIGANNNKNNRRRNQPPQSALPGGAQRPMNVSRMNNNNNNNRRGGANANVVNGNAGGGGGSRRGQNPNNNQHQQHLQLTNPRNKNKNKPQQQQQQQQQQRNVSSSHQYNQDAPPGFGGPPAHRHNPYQDALYAKSQKPLFLRFEDLHKVPMDKMAVETITHQPEFMAGPMNRHGVRLPV